MRGRSLRAILATHHHMDHVGGVLELLARFPGTPVYGHRLDRTRIPGLTHGVHDGATFVIGEIAFVAMHVPGHTRGALTYVARAVGDGSGVPACAFTGDTLFGAGCGRLFEGTAGEMRTSLQRLATELAQDTAIYCGHEYTESNLAFARHAEPASAQIQTRIAMVRALRAQGLASVPSLLREELQTNPFLRTDCLSLRDALLIPRDAGADEAFRLTREAKNHF
jgi:hydroxyacylglutathione hydrolase